MGVNGRGGIALANGEAAIARSIELILSTAKGERRMRPHFGCGIHDLVFAPNDATTAGLQTYVEEAIGWWEPRVEVMNIGVAGDDEDGNMLIITIRYRVRATNDERNLV